MSHDRKRVIIKSTRKKKCDVIPKKNENKVSFVFLLKYLNFYSLYIVVVIQVNKSGGGGRQNKM